jgi:hypothetical protein
MIFWVNVQFIKAIKSIKFILTVIIDKDSISIYEIYSEI